jgi:hypothetical protein
MKMCGTTSVVTMSSADKAAVHAYHANGAFSRKSFAPCRFHSSALIHCTIANTREYS